MGLGLRLRITNTQDNTVLERVFDRFPVRIGRNALNDLPLNFPFVSQFHCVLELLGNQLMLRDLGSTNGTLLRVGKVPPNTTIDLGPHNYEFAIVALRINASPVHDVQVQHQARQGQGLLAISAEEISVLMDPRAAMQQRASDIPPPSVDIATKIQSQLRPAYEAYRNAWAHYMRTIGQSTMSLDPGTRNHILQQVLVEHPAAVQEADFRDLLARSGVPTQKPDGVALQALQELATWYRPDAPPPDNAADVVAFVQRLQDVVDVFLKCFPPLREGYKQFKAQMYIPTAASPTAHAVERAKDARELAAGLLDYRDAGTGEGCRTIEGTFADLMVHQVAMLNGTMTGVRNLVNKLSPDAIEKMADDPKRKSDGLTIGPYRFKALWQLYGEVHGNYTEEKALFEEVFGHAFSNEYKKLAQSPVGKDSAFRTQGPQFSATMDHHTAGASVFTRGGQTSAPGSGGSTPRPGIAGPGNTTQGPGGFGGPPGTDPNRRR